MKEQSIAAGSARASRQRAGELLSQNGYRLLLIEALAVCLLFVSMYVLLDYAHKALLLLFETWNWAATLTVTLFSLSLLTVTLFLVFPTLTGLCRMAERIHHDEKPVLADLFYFFATRERYALSLAISVRVLWRLTLVLTAARVTAVLCTSFLMPEFWCLLLCAVLVSLELLGGIVWVLGEFPLLYLCLRYGDDIEGEGERASQILYQSPAQYAMRFLIGFLPQILLGLLTCGILLIADTIPRMLIAYFDYCETLFCCNEEEKQLD